MIMKMSIQMSYRDEMKFLVFAQHSGVESFFVVYSTNIC